MCGLQHEAIQGPLLSEVDLTYAKAMELALGMEAADRDTKAFKASNERPQQLSYEALLVRDTTEWVTKPVCANFEKQNATLVE